jgi:multicomponent K+:H+ antiporter subunit D
VTLAIGSIGILGATTLPRLAAYAAIGSMGTAFLAISAFTPVTTAAALYYILHSTIATAALFLTADLVARRRAHVLLTEAAPLAQSGLIGALFMASAIALAGMPPLSGFIGKLLILDAFRADAPLVWSAILVSSFLMILGLARAGSLIFWKSEAAPAPDQAPELPGPETLTFASTIALLVALAALTVFAGPVMQGLTTTAEALYDPAAYIAANRLGDGS